MNRRALSRTLLFAGVLCAHAARAEPNEPLNDFARRVQVFSGGMGAGNRAVIVVDDRTLVDVADRIGRGLNLVAFKEGEFVLQARFDTSGDPEAARRFYKTVIGLAAGTYVVIAACDDASRQFTDQAATAIRRLGGKHNLANKFRWSYLLIGRKGMKPGEAIEKSTPSNVTHNVSAEAFLAQPVRTE